ncbi:MAG: tetratricopeptide (TPR) repeat protein [Paracoccaceae bacterium]|jgi:tetratricopeptide (TPR) repeat protein
MRISAAFVVCLALVGCAQPDARLSPLGGGPRPDAAEDAADNVDGLVVGHRLMAAAEYDLALRAYYRAAGAQGLTADVLSAIGSANLKLGRLGQAESNLRRATLKDERFAAAWNNLGVVLMEQGKPAEAARVFRIAFGLDSGESADIRQNLTRALALVENPAYDSENSSSYSLVRRGSSVYKLLAAP